MTEEQEKERAQARSRLIDHFKRVYTIVVGLAITEAVKRLFPLKPDDLPVPALWMFGTFFITIVPIFHGGDRSLDVKYLFVSQDKFKQRSWYLWDVYMLILTAILFVCIAETIPQKVSAGSAAGTYPNAGLFYGFMAAMLVFDVVVLFIDRKKSEEKSKLAPYILWMGYNVILALVCFLAMRGIGINSSPSAETMHELGNSSMSFLSITVVVFIFALTRTIIDYISDHIAGGNFLFP